MQGAIFRRLSTLKSAFTHLAATGFRVFPAVRGGKTPAVASWTLYKEQAPTPGELGSWDEGDFNVAIITGAPSDIVVLDPDDPEAQAFVDELALPCTVTVKTGKGRHYYFRPPPGGARNRTKIAGKNLDIRGDGGYVIAPPSLHPSGAAYEWIVSPHEAPIAPFPDKLLALLDRDREPGQTSSSASYEDVEIPENHGVERFLALDLRARCRELAKAQKGSRNDELFRLAVRLAEHVAAADAEWEPFADEMSKVARQIGLDDSEILATLASAWKTGQATPTRWIRIAREYVYLGVQDRFYQKTSGTHLRAIGFDSMYGPIHGDKGRFSTFLTNGGFIEKVHDLTYEPAEPHGVLCKDQLELYNTYVPADIVPRAGDATPFTDFVEYLVPDAAAREHLIRAIAFTVRNPGKKLRHAIMLRTAVQGVGKSLLTSVWGRLMGEKNVRKTTSAEIRSGYHGWITQNTLLVCEELNIGVGLQVYNDLKDMITSDFYPVNEKHLAVRHWPTHSTIVMLTNLEKPILIERTDRRLWFYDSPAERRSSAYYRDLVEWLDQNLDVIRHYLDGIDLSDFDPHAAPPMTEAKARLIEDSQSSLAQDIRFYMDERIGCFAKDIVTLDEVAGSANLWQSRPTDRKLAQALVDLGAEKLGQHMVDGRRLSLWAIRRGEIWRSLPASDRVEEFKQKGEGRFAIWDEPYLELLPASKWPGDPRYMYLSQRGPRTLEEVDEYLASRVN